MAPKSSIFGKSSGIKYKSCWYPAFCNSAASFANCAWRELEGNGFDVVFDKLLYPPLPPLVPRLFPCALPAFCCCWFTWFTWLRAFCCLCCCCCCCCWCCCCCCRNEECVVPEATGFAESDRFSVGRWNGASSGLRLGIVAEVESFNLGFPSRSNCCCKSDVSPFDCCCCAWGGRPCGCWCCCCIFPLGLPFPFPLWFSLFLWFGYALPLLFPLRFPMPSLCCPGPLPSEMDLFPCRLPPILWSGFDLLSETAFADRVDILPVDWFPIDVPGFPEE